MDQNADIKGKRIKDAHAARTMWTSFRTASLTRRNKWAQVQNQLDGAPPFSNNELVKFGQGWRCNINFRDAASMLEQVLVQYWRLLHDTPNLLSIQIHEDDPNKERYIQIFQENFNRFVDDWGDDYVRNYLLLCQNLVAFGVGVMSYNDKWTPRWEVVRLGEIEVPAKAKSSISKINLAMVRQEVELEELWDLIRTDQKRSDAQQAGWNTKELDILITRESQNRDATYAIQQTDVLEMQRVMHNNAAGVAAGREPIKLVHCFVREYDGKVSRYIFAEKRSSEAGEFLFDDSSSSGRPENMTQVLAAIFFDAGNGDFWGTKGFGVKNYGLSTIMNRLKSRAVDRTIVDGLNFRDLSEGAREVVPITNIGPFNFLPKDVEQVPNYPTGRSVLETIQMLEQQSSYNNSRYRETEGQIANTDTATQANILANLQGQVDVGNATLYLKQWASNVFTEQFRRLRLRGTVNADAKTFKKRCVEEMGMPETVFHDAEVSLRTGADPGAANMAVQGQQALQLMNLPEANRRWAQERYVAATFGAQAVKQALLPVDATAEIRSQRLALIENSEMGQGNPMPVDPQDNHSAHLPIHLQPVGVIIDQYNQSGRLGSPDQLIALQLSVPHIEEHFKYLKADKLQEQLYRQLWPQWTAIRSSIEGIMRQVERMHNDAMQQQQAQGAAPQQPGQGPQGFSPSGMVGANTPQ